MVADEITLQKVSISRIKQEMRDVYYLSDVPGDRFVRHPPRYAGQLPRPDRRLLGDHHGQRFGRRSDRYGRVRSRARHDRLLQPRPRDPHGGQHQRCGGLFRRLFQIVHQRDPDRPFGLAARLYAFRQTALPAGDTPGHARDPTGVPTHQDDSCQRQGTLQTGDHPLPVHRSLLHHHRAEHARAEKTRSSWGAAR